MSELTQTRADFEGPGLVKPFQGFLISRRHDELWKDPSSLTVSSLGLSHRNLLAPLLVSKHCVSGGAPAGLSLFPPRASSSQLCSLIYLLHLSLCALSITSCFWRGFPSVWFRLYLRIFNFSLILLNRTDDFSVISISANGYRLPSLQRRTATVTYLSLFLAFCLYLSCLASDKGEYKIYTYHTQIDWREGLWHRQIIERIQHVIQVIFLGETNKQQKRQKINK